MVISTNKHKPPPSTDAPAWRKIADAGRLDDQKPEEVIAAFQDAGAHDRRLREAMAGYISALVMRVLRNRVGRNKGDGGRDIIGEVHDSFFDALCQPKSADAKGYRTAFVGRLTFRLKDAIAEERKATVIDPPTRTEPNDGSALGALARAPEPAEGGVAVLADREKRTNSDGVQRPDPTLMANVDELLEGIDVERILELVPDYRKRQAFRYFMDGVPLSGTKGTVTIARACGVDRKTVKHWIAEVREFLLTQVPQVQALKRRTSGE